MAKEKPGFYIWFKTVDVMAELTFEEKGMLYSAMAEYARDGVIPTFDDRLLRSIWTQLQYDLNADHDRYEKTKRENQIKGWTSDFKRNYAPKHGIDPNDEEALQAFIELRKQQSTAVNSGQPQSTNNNTNININNNSNINNSERDNNNRSQQRLNTPAPLTLGRYNNVHLTDVELAELKAEYPGKWEAMIENLSAKIAMKGYRFENHLATLRSWEQEDEEKAKDKTRQWRGYGDLCAGITSEDHENDCELPW